MIHVAFQEGARKHLSAIKKEGNEDKKEKKMKLTLKIKNIQSEFTICAGLPVK